MFCSKCGKTIDDNATFCSYCGAPAPNAAAQSAPQQAAPQQPAPQQPQYGAPQNNMQQPQYGGYPNQRPVGAGFTLNPQTLNLVNMVLRVALILLSILILIGAIVSMATAGSYANGNILKNLSIHYLACAPANVAFGLSVIGACLTFYTKQRSLFSYISAGAGLILFIFNFVMHGSMVALAKSGLSFDSFLAALGGGTAGKPNIGGVVVAGIFLIIGALAMAGSSVIILMKKEDIIKYRPKF